MSYGHPSGCLVKYIIIKIRDFVKLDPSLVSK